MFKELKVKKLSSYGHKASATNTKETDFGGVAN
jgi:hypothetical protein